MQQVRHFLFITGPTAFSQQYCQICLPYEQRTDIPQFFKNRQYIFSLHSQRLIYFSTIVKHVCDFPHSHCSFTQIPKLVIDWQFILQSNPH